MRHILIIFILLILPYFLLSQSIQEKIKQAGCADQYPGADLVVIFDSTKVDVRESGLSYVNFHHLYKILTPQGALDRRVITIGYDPLSAWVEILGVTVYRKDGTIEEKDLKTVQDYPAPARAIYWGAREKMIEVGRLNPGDAVEVKLFRKGFTYALLAEQEDDERYIPPMRGHFYDIVEFWTSQPVIEKVYQVWIPKDKPLQYEVYNGAVQSSIHFKGDKALYTFIKKDIQPFKREPNMVATSDEAPKLLLSTSPDWYAKGKWFYGVNEDYGSFEYTPEIKKKVDEILEGARGEDEKIYRLTHWVADNIRYSGLSMGPGEGYTLHTGEMTFRDRCGVCKDKAGMLVTMLRAAGFESYAAMTMAGSRIDYIPADQFNHSVTLVKKSDGKFHLLDPTWVPFVRELWSSAEQQQQYLMGLPEGSDLATTPISPPENHYYHIAGESEILENGTLKGWFELEAEGQSDAVLRRMFVRRPKTMWDAFIEQEMIQAFPQIKIEKMIYDDPYDYSEPIKLVIHYQIPGFAQITDKAVIFTPLVVSNLFRHGYLNDHMFFDTSMEERQYGFRTRSSKQIVLKEKIKLPRYTRASILPKADTVSGSGADFSGSYSLKGRTLTVNTSLTMKKRLYEPEDWPSFRKALLAQRIFADENIILER